MNVFVDAGKYLISFEITNTIPCILVVDVYKNDGAYVDSFALYSDSEKILGIFMKRMPDISYDDIRFFISEIEKLVKDPTDRISFLKKMEEKGAKALSDLELLAVILGSGIQDKDVFEMANDILKLAQSDFDTINLEKLKNIAGIGLAKACQIMGKN